MSIDDGPPLANNTLVDVGVAVVDDVVAAAAAASSTTTATNDDTTGAEIPITPIIFIHGLVILPPRQKKKETLQKQSNGATSSSSSSSVGVALPPLRPEEPVASLRGALGEMVGYAHLTRYRLVVEKKLQTTRKIEEEEQKDEKSNGGATRQNHHDKHYVKLGGGASREPSNDFVWSPYTLRDADVDMSPSLKSLMARDTADEEIVLDEYGDLSLLLPLLEGKEVVASKNGAPTKEGETTISTEASAVVTIAGEETQNIIRYDASNTIAIRVVFERYDLASVYDHMTKVRNLLKGNAPYVISLVGSDDVIVDDGDGKGVDAMLLDEGPMTINKERKEENKTKKKMAMQKKCDDSDDHDGDNEKVVSNPVMCITKG